MGGRTPVRITWSKSTGTRLSWLAAGRGKRARRRGYLRAARGAPALRTLAAQISEHLGDDIGYVQLRVEKDWQAYSQMKMAGGRKGFVLTPEAIFEKIANAPETARYRRWFAFCDLSGLPWDSEWIKAQARDRFGMELLFKTDLPDSVVLPASALENASLDFEIGFLAETYVGLVNATHSSLLYAARLAITPTEPATHYLYSGGSDRAVRRTDRGRGRR